MRRLAVALCLATLLPACTSGTSTYFSNRGGDLVDILRVHALVGPAIAAEVQVTQWLGVGFAWEDDVWAGGLHNRAVGAWSETVKAWGLLIHDWSEATKNIPAYSGSYGWYRKPGGPSFHGTGNHVDIWTLRATAALLIGIDLELRLGEVVDFVGGIFTWDPAGDDSRG